MKNKSSAFTLIELLVVVLIIGILAAVAVPQYQVAVDKARYSTMIVTVKAVFNARELNRLANGIYSNDITDLSDVFPAGCNSAGECKDFFIRFQDADTFGVMRNVPGNAYLIKPNGKTICYAYKDKGGERGRRLCKSLGGIQRQSEINQSCDGDCTTYTLP